MKRNRENAFTQLRKSCGLTQQQLADKCGVSVKTIQLWELKGTMSANISTLSKAANAMGADLSQVLC